MQCAGQNGKLLQAEPFTPHEQLRQIILDCGLPETVRGERLSLEQFAVLSSALH